MSIFSDLERMVSAEVDDHFGERTRLVPMAQGGMYFEGSEDDTRDEIETRGVVDFDPVTVMSQDRSRYDGMRPSIAGEKLHVSYDYMSVADADPQSGDQIQLLDRPETPTFQISRVDHDGLGRIICICSPSEADG
jgi:hypothetical protein